LTRVCGDVGCGMWDVGCWMWDVGFGDKKQINKKMTMG
jgi:hypothetical protein